MNKLMKLSLGILAVAVLVTSGSFSFRRVAGHVTPMVQDRANPGVVKLVGLDAIVGKWTPSISLQGYVLQGADVAKALAADKGKDNVEKDGDDKDKDEKDDKDQGKDKDEEGGGWDRLWDAPTLG
jgi:hypothetical protein